MARCPKILMALAWATMWLLASGLSGRLIHCQHDDHGHLAIVGACACEAHQGEATGDGASAASTVRGDTPTGAHARLAIELAPVPLPVAYAPPPIADLADDPTSAWTPWRHTPELVAIARPPTADPPRVARTPWLRATTLLLL